MAKAIPYIICENALDLLNHYNEIFGDVLVQRQELSPEMAEKMGYKGDLSKTTMHMVMNFGGHLIMASDDMAGYGVSSQNILLDFDMDNEKAIQKIKDVASKFEANDECKTLMPLQEQFWGGMMGQYKDKFGNLFMLHAQSYEAQRKQGGVLESYYAK